VLCYNRVKFSLRPDWSETTLYVNVTIGTSITTLTVDLADPQSLPVMRSLIDVHITRLGVYIGRKQRREQLKPKWDAFQTTRSK
jgi:energy-converting hydrogenase Eha subunit F